MGSFLGETDSPGSVVICNKCLCGVGQGEEAWEWFTEGFVRIDQPGWNRGGCPGRRGQEILSLAVESRCPDIGSSVFHHFRDDGVEDVFTVSRSLGSSRKCREPGHSAPHRIPSLLIVSPVCHH